MGTATMENSMKLCQEIKNRATIWSSNSTSGNISEGNELLFWTGIYTSLFRAALLTIAKIWK